MGAFHFMIIERSLPSTTSGAEGGKETAKQIKLEEQMAGMYYVS